MKRVLSYLLAVLLLLAVVPVAAADGDCPHEHTVADIGWTDSVCVMIDAEQHQRTGMRVDFVFCQDCGQYISWNELGEGSEAEAHFFAEGECVFCGYKKQCEHQHVEKTVSWTDPQYTYVDAGNHLVSGEKASELICFDCGEVLESTPYGYCEELQSHLYNNGVCIFCGSENHCAHEHTVEQEAWNGNTTEYA